MENLMNVLWSSGLLGRRNKHNIRLGIPDYRLHTVNFHVPVFNSQTVYHFSIIFLFLQLYAESSYLANVEIGQ